MTNIGVIGCGQWGPNHIRNFTYLPNSRVVICADLSTKRLSAMRDTFRGIETTQRYKEVLRHRGVQAVVISVPTGLHYRLVKDSLLAGKDVLCEKPLCLKEKEATELVRLARQKKKILMVGHVFLFNAGIRKMRELIRTGKVGRLYYMHSARTNLGPFRTDVNAAWDLATHDIYIFNHLLNAMPKEVSARGGRYLQRKIEDVTFITLAYPGGILVSIHVSWLDPKKLRQITVVGDKKMLCWDDLDSVGPVKIYDRRVVSQHYYETFGDFHLLAREGNITIPKINLFEPLRAQDAHFLDCVRSRKSPMADGVAGLEVVKVVTAIQKSLARRGAPVKV